MRYNHHGKVTTVKNFWDCFSLGKSYYQRCFAPLCKQYDLTAAELDILMFLDQHPEYDTATDITEKRTIAKPNVSTALRKLTERRLIEGVQSTEDRRRIHLHLLTGSRPILRDAAAVRERFINTLFSDFSEDDFSRVKDIIIRLYTNVKNASDTTP